MLTCSGVEVRLLSTSVAFFFPLSAVEVGSSSEEESEDSEEESIMITSLFFGGGPVLIAVLRSFVARSYVDAASSNNARYKP